MVRIGKLDIEFIIEREYVPSKAFVFRLVIVVNNLFMGGQKELVDKYFKALVLMKKNFKLFFYKVLYLGSWICVSCVGKQINGEYYLPNYEKSVRDAFLFFTVLGFI